MEQSHILLNHLDKPSRFLFFTLDEFIALAAPIFTGMVAQWALLGLITGVGLYWLLRVFKKQFPGGNLRKIFYWYLPNGHTVFKLPIASCVREWV